LCNSPYFYHTFFRDEIQVKAKKVAVFSHVFHEADVPCGKAFPFAAAAKKEGYLVRHHSFFRMAY